MVMDFAMKLILIQGTQLKSKMLTWVEGIRAFQKTLMILTFRQNSTQRKIDPMAQWYEDIVDLLFDSLLLRFRAIFYFMSLS